MILLRNKQETDMTEIRELTMDELDVVSGGDKGVMGWIKEIVNTAIKDATTPYECHSLTCQGYV
jgi:hypothetical protein